MILCLPFHIQLRHGIAIHVARTTEFFENFNELIKYISIFLAMADDLNIFQNPHVDSFHSLWFV